MTVKQIRESRSSEVLPKDRTQRVSPFYHKSLHASSFIDFLWILMKTTRIHSTTTNWRKNSMIGAVPGTSSRGAVRVVVLQILGVNALMWTTLRWSQNDFSMVQCFQTYWERSTNFVCIENILIPSCNERKSLSVRSSHLIQTSSSRSCSSMAVRTSGDDILSFLEFSHICGHEVVPS